LNIVQGQKAVCAVITLFIKAIQGMKCSVLKIYRDQTTDIVQIHQGRRFPPELGRIHSHFSRPY